MINLKSISHCSISSSICLVLSVVLIIVEISNHKSSFVIFEGTSKLRAYIKILYYSILYYTFIIANNASNIGLLAV